MKKKISLLILSVIFALSAGIFLAAGCSGCDEEPKITYCRVEFFAAEHVAYKCDGLGEDFVSEGAFTIEAKTEIRFTVNVEKGYNQTPQVLVNGTALTAKDGAYTYFVETDISVEVSSVYEIDYELTGSGTSESPYILETVEDLDFMAGVINSGSVSYLQAYYKLGGDIDCGGATLQVIGNGSTVNSFFGGYFDGDGYTVSNYKIEAHGLAYVGFFGFVQASANDDGLGTITNLNLKDFEISAYAAPNSNVFAGSFYGYGIAANLIVCSAVNGTVDVYGDAYFCYAGGASGVQQSAYVETDGGIYPFYSVTNYVNTEVDIYLGDGYIYAAGGIAGYVFSEHEFATALITNCYSTGNVFGAIRAGGIVGWLGNYSSVANCYSTGNIESKVNGNNDSEDYNALAGGIAAYAGFNTVITNCFSTAELLADAELGKEHEITNGIVAAQAENEVATYPVLIVNCYSGSEANATSAGFIKNSLKWSETDWVIKDGSLPLINKGETASAEVNITLNYGNEKVNSKSTETKTVSIAKNYYAPMSDYFLFMDSNGSTYLSEAIKADGGNTSYGYFLDSKLTQRVPYGYVPMGNVTLYVGFANYNDVAGVYYYTAGNRTVTIELDVDGTFTYIDGVNFMSSYYYDGKTVYLNDGLFARLSSYISSDDSGENPNLNYEAYKFIGAVSAGKLSVYDGVYFTEESPLVLTNEKPAISGDEFKGVWEKSATINKKYTFDGDGNWTYSFKGEDIASGTYTVTTGTASLIKDGQTYATAKIDASGLLLIDGEYFCLEGSLFGIWFNEDTGNYVRFDGYGGGMFGNVVVNIESTYYELTYMKDGFFGENTVTLINGYTLYGYLELGLENNVLSGIIYSAANGGFTDGYVFYLIDDYSGEWIGESVLGGVDFKLVNFNGLGTYEVTENGVSSKLGYIEINGEKVPYIVNIENGLEGSFVYGNVEYTLSYDEVEKIVTIGNSDKEVSLVRKDELYAYTLVSSDNRTVLKFNGGGYLTDGGVLSVETTNSDRTVTVAEYTYKINKCDISGLELDVEILNGSNKVGSLTVSGYKFRYVNGNEDKLLEIKSPFTGDWSVGNNMWRNFTVQNFDLSFTASGKFWDMDVSAKYYWNTEANYLAVSYIGENMTVATTIYILYLEEGNVALSTYPYLSANDIIYYACITDELGGTWYNAADLTGLNTISFDGLADSKFTNGIAFDGVKTYLYTRRFGSIYMWNYMDESEIYVLKSASFTSKDEDVYNDGRRSAFRLVGFDASNAVITATDGDGVTYEIFLDGTLNVGNRSGSYLLVKADGDRTEILVEVNGEKMRVEIDHDKKTATILN